MGLRLILLLAHPPTLIQTGGALVERGLTEYGDFLYHFGVADTSRIGLLPYRDFWYEYPPLIPLLSGAVYGLSRGDFAAYASLLALILTGFDVGNLALVRHIGARLRGPAAGDVAAWLYGLMAAPLVLAFWNFEALVAFWALLSLAFMLDGRDKAAGVAIGLGALSKLVPLVLLGVVWRFKTPRAALQTSAVALILTAAGLAGVVAFGPRYALPSLSAQWNKASFQTVWALIDGNTITGAFGPDRRDPRAAAEMRGNPPAVPPLLRTVAFAGLGIATFALTRRRDEAGMVRFAALTIVIVYLWSAGWSTQWQALLVPLLLLTLPVRTGALAALALAVVSVAEYPLLYARAAGPDGALRPEAAPLLALTVLARTAILAGWGAALFHALRREADA
ncbi:MAG: hypothetical protein IT323_11925 [Anaerolineae bacterium]|nr:hypothetical protein [Anaerolineae bacterium]